MFLFIFHSGQIMDILQKMENDQFYKYLIIEVF